MRDRSVDADLSFAQRRLWFLDQLAPGSAEYVIPYAFRVRGVFDIGVLESAFSGVLGRHEVLRTRFAVDGEGEPVQVVDPSSELKISVIDLGEEPDPVERERVAFELAEREASLGFDLAAGRLVRVTVVSLSVDEHLLLVSMHHVVADGWSMGVLARELREFYAAGLEGRDVDLPQLPVQYADFAVWQREWLSGEVLERQLVFWREQLAGLEPLELPTDRPRPLVRSSAGGAVRFGVSADVARRLSGIATWQSASLFMVGLAAFQVVLSRWSGQDDVAVGSPIAGRNRAEVEDLVGFFVNELVMRSDLSDNPSFTDLLGRVRETALGAYEHQDLPFERLVEDLAPERDLSRNPLFQVSFVLQNFEDGEWVLPGLEMEPVEVATTISKFDLILSLTERSDGGLDGEVVFSSELFDESTAARLAGHFVRVLESVSADPGQRVGQIDLLSEAERRQILVEWNDTAVPFADDVAVHQLVEAQAARTPDAVAVVCGEEQLTYAQLNTRA
ncbi:condensation domain-containing protein, partial [Streptomyces sp. NPDC021218]|uniref:condensation domain-containing protein n=1 Tax=Streptomyces sp. NPDC021218 TaxID=3365119 RepID=UPI0037B58702